MHAAAFGSPETMKLLLDAGADVNAKNAFDATALIWSARDPVKSKLLIEHGAQVNVQSRQGRTPLILAAKSDSSAGIVRLMLAKGADPNVKDSRGETALLLAAGTGDTETMRLLMAKGADVNTANAQGDTPIMFAALGNSLDAVKLLLAKGANVNAATTSYHTVRHGQIPLIKLTALIYAAPYASPELVRTLIEAGANVNAQDARGLSPLMVAVATERQDLEIVRMLLRAGADVNLKSALGETALDWAEKFGHPAVLAALRAAGAQEGEKYAAPPPPTVTAAWDVRKRVQKSVALLQASSTEFFKESGCVGCHHQPMAAMAVRAARERGIPVDEGAAREQTNVMNSSGRPRGKNSCKGSILAAVPTGWRIR